MATKRTTKEVAVRKTAKAAPKRKAVARPASKTRAAAPAAPAKPATEIVALRAYFISERRNAAGIPGDSTSDWLEAERQILAETAK